MWDLIHILDKWKVLNVVPVSGLVQFWTCFLFTFAPVCAQISCEKIWECESILETNIRSNICRVHNLLLPILPIPRKCLSGVKKEQIAYLEHRVKKKREEDEVQVRARIHYLSVLYLFHMLLFSNLSLQIPDSENKRMDQSCGSAVSEQHRHSAAQRMRAKIQPWLD